MDKNKKPSRRQPKIIIGEIKLEEVSITKDGYAIRGKIIKSYSLGYPFKKEELK